MQRVDMENVAALYATRFPDWATGTASQFHFGVKEITLKSGDVIRPQASGVTVIVGSNNAGKSTILRELHQWIHHHPSQPRPPMISVDSVSLDARGSDADMFAWIGLSAPFAINGTSMGFARSGGLHDPTNLAYLWSQPHNGIADLAQFFMFYGNAAGRFSIGGSAEMREAGDDPAVHPIHTLQDSRELRDRLTATSQQVFGKPLTLDTLGRTVRLRVGEVDAPSPPIDDIPPAYRAAMAALSPLDEQGDGMRGFFGQVLPVIAATYPVILLDEPEAFLHPPQAHALGAELGALAVERGVQILVATHDRSLLTGLLDSGVQVSVVRASRGEGPTRVHQLDSSRLQELWHDPVLKYTNVLDGLFHRVVMLAEAEGDCAYLNAGLDFLQDSTEGLPRNEALFVPTGGKDAMWKVASTLRAVAVPVIAAPDLDMLNNEAALSRLVVAMGGEWDDDFKTTWNRATAAQRAPRESVNVGHVLDAIDALFNDRRDEPFTAATREELFAQARSRESPWAEVKAHGIDAFRGEARAALLELLTRLESLGVVLVREGELERLAPEVAARKGPGWLQEALSIGAQGNERTQKHLQRLVDASTAVLQAG
ncbi:ATP-dependent endonuclease [Microbacterium sp. AG238]|jgi:energy-coupling factor transporter ATP-binding protein EcfA2|uniref:ATP-dependent nuclease n=1 Tax=Microbacterium sp. AG238 TaxID=2183994 RepID=UPI000E71FA58|nr:AAA family ATPase [Microbacterium sp. AG238]RKE60390.1 putative AbiEii toxin of type IV toxin-antitoxin system [Microbacterium sp. AG238]